MRTDLLDRLDGWKRRYGSGRTLELERLLAAAARARFKDAASLIRFHETLLFLRAYPRSPRIARLTDAILFPFSGRIAELRAAGGDLSPFEDSEVSGIAGTAFSAVFSYEVARRLSERHGRDLRIDWDADENPEPLGAVASRFVPLLEEDWPVEAHVPFHSWIGAAVPRGRTDLGWLLERIGALPIEPREQARMYDSLRLFVRWELGDSPASRSNMRLPVRQLFCHSDPLLQRRDISLPHELESPPIPVTRLSRRQAQRILDLILDTSAMRYRELYGFTHPDTERVFRADAGRGVEIYFFGVPPEWRLPLRAYHGGLFFKNGVPAGYVEMLSLFERAEVGFNLYYTFREGESAWLYARVLRLFRQVLGVTCFSVDPYQLGQLNEEAIDSGAFWFYRKLGFRPVTPGIARLAGREERRIREKPGYRTPPRTLEKLAEGYVLYEAPGAEPGAWDSFRVRNLGLAVGRRMAQRFHGDAGAMRRALEAELCRTLGIDLTHDLALVLSLIPDLARWSDEEKTALAAILRAKQGADESRYLLSYAAPFSTAPGVPEARLLTGR